MTNDYKETLLKYMTGKLENETGVNEPQFGNSKETAGNVRYQVAQSVGREYNEVLVVGKLYSEEYETFLVYGRIYPEEGFYNFIAVFDKNATMVQFLTAFDSGTAFFNITAMQQDETGKIYALSRNDDVVRVLLLNNIFSSNFNDGNYKVVLRQSYIVPSNFKFSYNSLAGGNDVIKKAQNEAVYYLSGNDLDDSNLCKIIKFQINVGSENEWTMYTIANMRITYAKFTVLLQAGTDGTIYNLYGIDIFNKKFVKYKIDEKGNITLDKSVVLPFEGQYIDGLESMTLAVNDNLIYVVANFLNNNNVYITNIYSYINNELSLLYVSEGYTVDSSLYPSIIELQNINNNVFMVESKPNEGRNGTLNIAMLIGNKIFINNVGEIYSRSLFSKEDLMLITNQYNLYRINVSTDVNSAGEIGYINKQIILIYNQNNYNGLPYKALNSLIPNSGILYDNDDVIFARNLYNKTVSGATTTSTVQIPNTLLNDTTIAQSDLIGQTNMELVNDTTPITKNIYETVDINFSNTLVIRNDNDENNKILNPIGSSRLNNSISQTIDYESAEATKIKINYADGTNEIIELGSSQITILTNTKARYNFSIYVQKEINNIQIISFDENTIYQTINNLNLTIGKTYSITQDVEVL